MSFEVADLVRFIAERVKGFYLKLQIQQTGGSRYDANNAIGYPFEVALN